jgi:signal transduction histidine kinase
MTSISISLDRCMRTDPTVPGSREPAAALVLALGAFVVGTDAFVIAGFLPSMAATLGVSPAAGGQAITVFVVTFAILAPVLATVTSRMPRRTLLVTAMVVLAAANLGSALAPNVAVLITTRVVAAGAAAACTPIIGAVCTLVRPGHRARAMVTVVGGLATATALAVALGRAGDGWLGWRAVLGAVAVAFLLTGAATLRVMPPLPGRPRVPLRARAAMLRRPAMLAVLPITVLGLAAGYSIYAYSLPELGAPVVPESVVVLALFGYGLVAVVLNAVTGLRRAGEERLRIARELHDSLTHSISIIKVQAGVAVHLARKRGEHVPDTLLAIQEASGEAMRELRATLQVLRDPDGEPLSSGLDLLTPLVERARSAGLPTTVTVTGRQRPLATDVDHTAYRIIQEALTNITRHAGHATASVHLCYDPGTLTVQIDDDGQATLQTPTTPGIGITGMRERVTTLGGRLHASPRPQGGFSVRAQLPLDRQAGTAPQTVLAAVGRIAIRWPASRV